MPISQKRFVQKLVCPAKDAGDILDMVIDEIKGELIAGRDVKISSFGSFLLKRKNAASAAIRKLA